MRAFVKNVAALPEQLDKRTDPAKLKKDKPPVKEKKQREKHTHREDRCVVWWVKGALGRDSVVCRWVPAIVTDADHKLKKDVTDILNKLTPRYSSIFSPLFPATFYPSPPLPQQL